jgi:hypothetical protein
VRRAAGGAYLGDDYASVGKPLIDWENAAEREALIDSRARNAFAPLTLLDEREVGEELTDTAQLLANVVEQNLAESKDGMLRIAH